jgi:hypothetical protein
MNNRYIILRDLTSIQGAKFFKNEVVLGKSNINGLHIDVIRENRFKNNINQLIKGKDIQKVPNSTPLTDELIVRDFLAKSKKINITSMTIGAIGGGTLAFLKKQGTLEYIAFMVLGAIAGLGVSIFINSKRKLIIPITDDNVDEKKSSEIDKEIII